MLLIFSKDFLTKALKFIRRIYNLYSLLERQREGFIKSIMLYKLAIFLASLFNPFILMVFNKILVILLNFC